MNYESRFNYIQKLALRRLDYFGVEESERHLISASASNIVDQLEIFAETATTINFGIYKSTVLFNSVNAPSDANEDERASSLNEIERMKLI